MADPADRRAERRAALERARAQTDCQVGAGAGVGQLRILAYLLGLERPALGASTCSRLAAGTAGLSMPEAVAWLVGCGLPVETARAAVRTRLHGPPRRVAPWPVWPGGVEYRLPARLRPAGK